jgi:hypothetical protein
VFGADPGSNLMPIHNISIKFWINFQSAQTNTVIVKATTVKRRLAPTVITGAENRQILRL